jgi:hypothetical protein
VSQFRILGLSKTGRTINRAFGAETPNGARRQAERAGIVVENVERLPPTPATDRQLAYARDLGITIPESPTLEQMQELISLAVDPLAPPALPASPWLVARARGLDADLDPERNWSVGYVSYRLEQAVGCGSPALDREWAFWFLHSVLRHQRQASWSSPEQSGVPDATMFALAERFSENVTAVKSMKRNYPYDFPPYQYVRIGGPGGDTVNKRTSAYARAVALLTEAELL